MVFAANSGLVLDGRVYLANFRHAEREGEEDPYATWFAAHGFGSIHRADCVNEGEGDFAVVGDVVLAGYGFRTDRAAHEEAHGLFGVPVVSLRLVDPRFYHLDTALAVLGDDDIAYYPAAFDRAAQRELRRRFPHAVIVSEDDALAFGCNAMSDGYHVVMAAQAHGLAESLRAAGYEPVPVDLSELRKAGGSVKCCTLGVRATTLRRCGEPSPVALEWRTPRTTTSRSPSRSLAAKGHGCSTPPAAATSTCCARTPR